MQQNICLSELLSVHPPLSGPDLLVGSEFIQNLNPTRLCIRSMTITTPL